MGSAAELLIDLERAVCLCRVQSSWGARCISPMERSAPRRPYPALACGVLPDRRHYGHLRLRNVVLPPSAPISNPGPGRRRGTQGERAKESVVPSDTRDDDEYVWGCSRPIANEAHCARVGVDARAPLALVAALAPGRFWLRPRGCRIRDSIRRSRRRCRARSRSGCCRATRSDRRALCVPPRRRGRVPAASRRCRMLCAGGFGPATAAAVAAVKSRCGVCGSPPLPRR